MIPELMVLTDRPDGSVWADRIPPCIEITRELLEHAHPAYVQRRFRTVRLNLGNGRVRYRLIKRNREASTYLAQRVW